MKILQLFFMIKAYCLLFLIACALAEQVAPLTANSITAASLNYAAGANTGLFAITSAGYYYLSEDLLLTQAPTNTNPIILINASNVVVDLATKTIAGNSNANVVFAGIQVADGVSNVTIKNGTINGISSATSAANGFGIAVNNGAATTVSRILVQDLSIFNCGYFGISVRSCNDLVIENVVCTGNGPNINAGTTGAQSGFAGGLYLETVKTGNIKNSSFSNNTWQVGSPTASNHIVGCLIKTCLDVDTVDSHFDNNTNTTTDALNGGVHAVGLWSYDTANCVYTNVSANSNSRSGSATTSGNSTQCYGFRLQSTTSPHSTGNLFTNCQAINNTGTIFCAGFGITDNSSGNNFVNCVANLNSCVATATVAASTYGFYFFNTSGNMCTNCTAIRNNTPGSTDASNPLRTAAGFFSASSTSNLFISCFSTRNFLSSQSGSNSFAAGFQLGNQTPFTPITGYPPAGGATTYVETASALRDCVANNNTTLHASTSAPCFGILILPGNVTFASGGPVSTGNRIETCRASYNVSQNTAVGRSYGIVDVTPGVLANSGTPASPFGSTTFMNFNISVGHGASLTGAGNTDAKTPITSFNMNYYLDYRTSATGTSHLSYVIIEGSAGYISNISNNASTASYNLQSWSLLYS